jgi:hypothetical protein
MPTNPISGKLKVVANRFQRPRDVLVLEMDKWAVAYPQQPEHGLDPARKDRRLRPASDLQPNTRSLPATRRPRRRVRQHHVVILAIIVTFLGRPSDRPFSGALKCQLSNHHYRRFDGLYAFLRRRFIHCLYPRSLPVPVTKATGILGQHYYPPTAPSVAANATTLASFTVTQAGSAAGQFFSATPPSPAYLNEDDVIVLTPSGASGASVPMHFSVAVRSA